MITPECAFAPDLDLIFLADPDREAREHYTHRTGVKRGAQRIESARGRSLSHAVSFIHRYAGTAEEAQQLRVYRRTAADKPFRAPAKCLLKG